MSDSTDDLLGLLQDIRNNSGDAETSGLSDAEITQFISRDSNLGRAINEGHQYHLALRQEFGSSLLMRSESE